MKEEAKRGAMDVRKSVATPESLPRSDNICAARGERDRKGGWSTRRPSRQAYDFDVCAHASDDLVTQPFDSYTLHVDVCMSVTSTTGDGCETEERLFEFPPRIFRLFGCERVFQFFQL